MMRRRYPICPKCGSNDIAKYVYGSLSSDWFKHSQKDGKEIAGGCYIDPESPQWKCCTCGHNFNYNPQKKEGFLEKISAFFKKPKPRN